MEILPRSYSYSRRNLPVAALPDDNLPLVFLPRHHQRKLINNSTSYTPIPDTLDWENQTRFKLLPRIELKQKRKRLCIFSCPHCNFAPRANQETRIASQLAYSSQLVGTRGRRERKRRMRTFLYYVEDEIWPKTNLRKERSRGTGMQMTSFSFSFLSKPRPRTKGSGCAREWLRRFRERPRRPKRTGAEEPPDIVGSRDFACLPFEFGDGDGDGDGDGEGKEFTDLDFPLPDNGTSRDNGRFHITTGRIELYCFCYLCTLGRGKQQHKCS
jgi:hypothetical protein